MTYLAAWCYLFKEPAQHQPRPGAQAAWLKERGFADVTPRQSPFITP